MSTPLVTICIPAYKAGAFIAETLETVAQQTFTDWEACIIEDGSQDQTESLVRAFAARVSQPVHFERHAVNRGLPATRNTAISRARGSWIALLDSDDLWTPDHLAHAVAHAQKSTAELIHTGVVMFDSDSGRDLERRVPSPEAISAFPLSLFKGEYIIQPSSTLIQSEALRRVGGFDPACRYVEDRELWLRLVRAGARVGYVDHITCRYRQHAHAMTRNAPAMAVGVAEVFERNLDWTAIPLSLRRGYAAEAWLSAARLVLRADPRLARRHLARARRIRPLAPRLWLYTAAACMLGARKT